MQPIIEVRDLSKTYASGTVALTDVTLDIHQGEILALLGPNGAGKTTFISITCGLVTPSGGAVRVGGHDVVRDFADDVDTLHFTGSGSKSVVLSKAYESGGHVFFDFGAGDVLEVRNTTLDALANDMTFA